jgi:hypothetical protein
MNIQFPGVSRQALLQEFRKTPESAIPKPTGALINPDAPKAYRFDDQMERFSSQNAGGLAAEAQEDAAKVHKGAAAKIVTGIVELGAGMLAFGACMALPLVMVPAGIAAMYFGMTTLRHGTDGIRQANYDNRFTQDVGRFSESAHHGTDPAQQYNFAGGGQA